MTDSAHTEINHFLDANPEIDIGRVDLSDDEVLESFSWKGVDTGRDEVLAELRAYQRLARLLDSPDRAVALGLMEQGISSALHIAAMPRPRFIATFSELFDHDQETMQRVYERALTTRSRLLVSYLRARQGNEPHASPVNHAVTKG